VALFRLVELDNTSKGCGVYIDGVNIAAGPGRLRVVKRP
jgi:hypothetical protein